MKVKNLMIGNVATIEYTEISLEDYWPSAFHDVEYMPNYIRKSIFYKTATHAYDIVNFRRYKIAQTTDGFPATMAGKKVVIFQQPFSDITPQENISRRKAIKTYQKKQETVK